LKAYNQRLELVPAYSDWNVLVNAGATDGISKIADMLLERGDAVLVEEWTYPGSTASILPLGVELVGIKMDGEGLIPDHLEAVLAGWDERKRGAPRPRLLYTIPTGQNPTGATMTGERKKRIYEICVEYDVIILEDDPYYHLVGQGIRICIGLTSSTWGHGLLRRAMTSTLEMRAPRMVTMIPGWPRSHRASSSTTIKAESSASM